MTEGKIRNFVLSYLHEIQADVAEADGVYTVSFPPGRKRRFGGQRRFAFDQEKAQPHVEFLEVGSPLLKLMLVDAKQWGGVGVAAPPGVEPGTLAFTFQLTTFSSLKKRTEFVTALLAPEATAPKLHDGIWAVFHEAGPAATLAKAVERVQNALPLVLPSVEAAGREFARDAVRESAEAFHKSLGRVDEYFHGLRQESASEEARIKKRLGEIQSKLYFAEDGLRQLKLERERDRLTQELYQLKQKRSLHEDRLTADHLEHAERQRRRHEPKLSVRLVAATLVTEPAAAGPRPLEPGTEAASAPPAPLGEAGPQGFPAPPETATP